MESWRVRQFLRELQWGGVTHVLYESGVRGHELLNELVRDQEMDFVVDSAQLIGAMEELLVADLDQPMIEEEWKVQSSLESSRCAVDVVIPWDVERESSPEYLRAFANSLCKWPLEVQTTLVLNGSDAKSIRKSVDVLREILHEQGVRNVRLVAIRVRPGVFRAGIARNYGAQLAKAPDLVFLDMDLRPALSFLRAPIRDEILIGLRQCVDEVDQQKLPQDNYWADFNQNADLRLAEPQAWKYVCSHSLKLKTATFRQCGGFAWSFQDYGHEDTEWAYRMAKAGLAFRAHHEIGLHLVSRGKIFADRENSMRKTAEIFLNLHPTFEVETFVRYLWNPSLRIKNWVKRVRMSTFGKLYSINRWGPNSKPVTSFPTVNPSF